MLKGYSKDASGILKGYFEDTSETGLLHLSNIGLAARIGGRKKRTHLLIIHGKSTTFWVEYPDGQPAKWSWVKEIRNLQNYFALRT